MVWQMASEPVALQKMTDGSAPLARQLPLAEKPCDGMVSTYVTRVPRDVPVLTKPQNFCELAKSALVRHEWQNE
jgi:hypothetical protein